MRVRAGSVVSVAGPPSTPLLEIELQLFASSLLPSPWVSLLYLYAVLEALPA